MLKLISLNVKIYLSIIILVLLFIHISNKGLLGLRLQKFCKSNSKLEKFLFFLMIFSILMFLNESFKGDSSSSVSFSFLGDGNLLDNLIWDSFYNNILKFFRPQAVEGYLDDLIGLELFIHFLLIMLVISVIILFIIYILINFMLQNKEFILNRFENKFIKFYLKYQIFLGKISVIVLPVLILFGLIQIFVGLFYIITHPLPLEELNSNLHIYIKKKINSIVLFLFFFLKFSIILLLTPFFF